MGCWSRLKPVAGLTIHFAATSDGLCRVSLNTGAVPFLSKLRREFPLLDWWRDDEHTVLARARWQLEAYFERKLTKFDLPLWMNGTSFQRRVWHALREIPCGETRSYREIAESIGAPRAARAVGAANGRNPVPIIVPCHRVIAADGSLGGYAAGLKTKRLLLGIETKTDPADIGG